MADLTFRRDLGHWLVRAKTLRGRAILEELGVPEKGIVFGHAYEAVCLAAQDAGCTVEHD